MKTVFHKDTGSIIGPMAVSIEEALIRDTNTAKESCLGNTCKMEKRNGFFTKEHLNKM